MKVLTILADNNENNIVAEALKDLKGCDFVENAFDGERGLEMATHNNYDFIVLNLILPKIGGKKLLVKLRQISSVPVLVLSNDKDFNVVADILESGADDYMVTPFEKVEFLARITAILRRSNNDFGTNKYTYNNLQVDFFEKSIKINGERMNVVAKMYEIFEYLIRHKNIIISKETLFNRVWGFESETNCSIVEVYISKLRKILAIGQLDNNLITIKNAGYMWKDKK